MLLNKRTPKAKMAAKYKSTPRWTPRKAKPAAKSILKKKPDKKTLESNVSCKYARIPPNNVSKAASTAIDK